MFKGDLAEIQFFWSTRPSIYRFTLWIRPYILNFHELLIEKFDMGSNAGRFYFSLCAIYYVL